MTFVEKIYSSFSDLLSFSNKAGRMDYLGGSIVIIILCVIFRGIISSIFFNQSQGIIEDKTNIFFLISLALLFQLPSSLYIGALMGLEKQFTANTLISIAAVSRGILAISFLYMESSLESFFLSQILVNICYLIFLRIAVMRNFTSFKKTKKFDVQVIKDNLAFSSNMALLSILGVILINSDKLLVASLLSLKDVGVYTLAFNLSMLPIMLCQIISISCYPTIIKEVEEFQETRFKEFYGNESFRTCSNCLDVMEADERFSSK